MSRRNTGIGPRLPRTRVQPVEATQPSLDQDPMTRFPTHAVAPEVAVAELASKAVAAGAVLAAGALLVRKVAKSI